MMPELFEILDVVADRCRERGIRFLPGNNIGYFGPSEQKLRWAQKHGGHYSGCTSGVVTIGHREQRRDQGLSRASGAPPTRGLVARARPEGAVGALTRRSRTFAAAPSTTCGAFAAPATTPTCVAAGCTATSEPLLGRPGNNPFCHHRALEMPRRALRERIELVSAAPDIPFANGLWQVVRESADPEARARTGPVAIERPRSSRLVEPHGPGTEVDPADYVPPTR